jgi:anaerobic C4-dicarboxylate transporter
MELLVFIYVTILYAELDPPDTVYDLLPVLSDIVKLLVIKPGLSVGVTSVGRGDIAVTSSSVPFPAVVIYGALNKL